MLAGVVGAAAGGAAGAGVAAAFEVAAGAVDDEGDGVAASPAVDVELLLFLLVLLLVGFSLDVLDVLALLSLSSHSLTP